VGDFTMPSLGADMEVGTVTEWLVQPGAQVQRGDIVAVVDTEKSTIEVEVFESGVVDRILVQEGQEVPVGTVLAHIRAGNGSTREPAVAAQTAPPEHAAVAVAGPAAAVGAPAPPEHTAVAVAGPAAAVAAPARPEGETHSPLVRHLAERLGVDVQSITGTGPGGSVTRADVERAASRPVGARPAGGRVRSSPLARRLAAERGWDLAAVAGSGPGGAVTAADVPAESGPATAGAAVAVGEAVAAPTVATETVGAPPTGGPAIARSAPATQRGAGRREGMRRATGQLMARSKREIPHYYLTTTVDMSRCMDWLERANADRPVADRLVPAALLLKATARAVGKVPEMNGFFVDGEFRPSPSVNVGVAISLRGGGLVAPAISDADHLSVDDLMVRLRDLVTRARAGVLRSSEVTDATVTVTNLGDLGVDSVFGVIYPPQVALVGFGRIADRPVARDGLLGVGPTLVATLAADHRASDGHRGGRFLAEIDRLLQEPEKL
jgi:pyruvate dehydrogenase E2 component (dihydrolipoyllysine-residue acetyltransferase)